MSDEEEKQPETLVESEKKDTIFVALIFGFSSQVSQKSPTTYGRGFCFLVSFLSFSFAHNVALAITKRAARIFGLRGFFKIH